MDLRAREKKRWWQACGVRHSLCDPPLMQYGRGPHKLLLAWGDQPGGLQRDGDNLKASRVVLGPVYSHACFGQCFGFGFGFLCRPGGGWKICIGQLVEVCVD
jgi:hypothetical protein